MDERIKEVLNNNGIDKVAFLYRNSPLVDNAYTACLLINKQKKRIESRGVSICSVLDPYNKNKGRQKALGRAFKALIRQQNFDKINPSGRDQDTVKREIKIKKAEDVAKFDAEKVPELLSINPDAEISIIDGTGGNFLKKLIFQIPLSYPIRLASENYKYKSQFRPNPAGGEETHLLNSLKEEKAI